MDLPPFAGLVREPAARDVTQLPPESVATDNQLLPVAQPLGPGVGVDLPFAGLVREPAARDVTQLPPESVQVNGRSLAGPTRYFRFDRRRGQFIEFMIMTPSCRDKVACVPIRRVLRFPIAASARCAIRSCLKHEGGESPAISPNS